MEAVDFAVSLKLEDGYRFTADFLQDDVPELLLDEPAPLGEGAGPNAARVLAVAVGNCLAASLLFCLKRARIEVQALRADVSGTMERNERGRLRITDVDVKLHPVVAEADVPRMQRCLDVFEDFCVVTQSVRDGLNVNVGVDPAPAPPVAV
ncbi:MAG TPA: OsmC family protein [Longimicrobiales bacterium]|nr:OsmC family protein [Longimicrobiales bacterium]